LTLPTYLERTDDGLGGTCTGLPDRQDIPVQVDERMVVEFYAR
jgi:ribosomal protein S4